MNNLFKNFLLFLEFFYLYIMKFFDIYFFSFLECHVVLWQFI